MQNYFSDRKVLCSIQGKPQEYIVFKRTGKSSSRFNQNNVFECLLQDDTQLTNGDIVLNDSEGTKYLVVARRDSYLSKTAQLYQANCTVTIVRLVKEFINGTATGKYTEQVLHQNVPALYQDINGKMQMYDSGLLSTSTRKFVIPKFTDVNLLDRIKFTDSCQIDVINTTEYDGLLSIQTQPDKRVVKTNG